MEWKDLTASPAKREAERLKRVGAAGRNLATAPFGVRDLGESGDIVWTQPPASDQASELKRVSVRDLPSMIEMIGDGLTTESRKNTVASEPPTSTDGYPEGAYWTVVASDGNTGKVTVKSYWKLIDGVWSQVGQDAATLTTGVLDAGLIDVVALWAKMVDAQVMQILDSAGRLRVQIDGNGIVMFDADGNQNGQFNGASNWVRGSLIATRLRSSGPWTLVTNGSVSGTTTVTADAQMTLQAPSGWTFGDGGPMVNGSYIRPPVDGTIVQDPTTGYEWKWFSRYMKWRIWSGYVTPMFGDTVNNGSWSKGYLVAGVSSGIVTLSWSLKKINYSWDFPAWGHESLFNIPKPLRPVVASPFRAPLGNWVYWVAPPNNTGEITAQNYQVGAYTVNPGVYLDGTVQWQIG